MAFLDIPYILKQPLANPTFQGYIKLLPDFEYNDKITITGNLIRHHHYEKPICKLVRVREHYYRNTDNPRSSLSLYRTRSNLVDTINTNLTKYTKFITLTYKENMIDRDRANYDLKQFTKRYKRLTGENLRYIGLLEAQERGALHFHLVVFMDAFIHYQTITDLWKQGFIDIKKVKSGDVGRYIAKYLTKDEIEHITAANQKIIYRSKGLKKPVVLRGKKALEYLDVIDGEILYHSCYPSQINGEVRMVEYRNSADLTLRTGYDKMLLQDKKLSTLHGQDKQSVLTA
jgi:hypothetical protein